MNDFSDEINKILRLAGVQLNEDNEYIPFILPDPSYKQFHDFFRITTYGKISAIIDNGTTIETSSGISFAKSDNSSFDVLSIYEGEVVDVTTDEVLGCSVTIKHANNVKSIYR